MLFSNDPKLRKVSDGTSKTIAFAESYTRADVGRSNYYPTTYPQKGRTAATLAHPCNGRRDCFGFNNADNMTIGRTNRPAASAPDIWNAKYNVQLPGALDDLIAPPIQSNPFVEDADGKLLQSIHPGTINMAMLDGSTSTFSDTIDPVVFWSMVTPAGHEVTNAP